jgi:two-component system chemotaxis sensor kinase CheA
MNGQDQEILQAFVEESREHLADVEGELLTAEAAGDQDLSEVINRVFRCVHSIKGGAGFLGLERVKELSHQMENVVGLMREGRLIPTPEIITVLLQATDRLRELVEQVEQNNGMEITPMLAALQGLLEPQKPPPQPLPPEDDPPPRLTPNVGPGAHASSDAGETLEVVSPDGGVRFAAPIAPLALELEAGRFVYLVEFDPAADLQPHSQDAAQVLQDIAQGGVILARSEPADEADPPSLPRFILFASLLDPDLVSGLLPVEERFIQNLTEDLRGRLGNLTPAVAVAATPEIDCSPLPEKGPPPASPAPKKPGAAPPLGEKGPLETSLRVHVSLLDRLMTLAGELVLGRNQLLQALGQQDAQALQNVAQKLNLVTGEIQETVMLTRMQPVSLVFNKFPRVVRDLARSLNKEVALTMEGQEVELDKTIIEGLHDPLTHLVRNAIDHGIETPQVRRRKGKAAAGTIILKAYHQAGQVNIEIKDDGQGLDPAKLAQAAVAKGLLTPEQNRSMSYAERLNLIFRPGFSTAEKVTEVSGRGVGMDVVKSNLDRLGGQVEIHSRAGEGTTFKIKLPLTLAIIPSLIVSVAGERFALPQVNVQELLRIPAHQVKDRLEKVGDAVVVRLRGQFLPLLPLGVVLGLASQLPGSHEALCLPEECLDQPEHGGHAASAVSIAVVCAGPLTYGLVVDEFHGAEEIVIKPLGSHLQSCRAYAGATIMGDGRVALILDAANLAVLAGLTSLAGDSRAAELDRQAAAQKLTDIHSLLVFHQGEAEVCAVPLFLVQRLEEIKAGALETLGGQRVIQYQGGSLPVFALEDGIRISALEGREDLLVIVLSVSGREVGLLAAPPVDAVDLALHIDQLTVKQPGVMGSAIINGKTTLILDVVEFLEGLKPEWFKDRPRAAAGGQGPTVLLAEDSAFFRSQVKKFLTEDGYQVVEAEDGLRAWELLQEQADQVQLVITDIEMPNMDGLALTARIKADQRFGSLPVIAVTSLAGEEDMARGRRAGVDDYQIKLDREQLLESVTTFLGGHSPRGSGLGQFPGES